MSRLAARSFALSFLALVVLAAAPLGARSSGTPERAFAGGSAVELRGLPVSAATTANLGLVNLAPAGNRCSLAFVGDDGTSPLPGITMTLRSFEERPLLDVFEGLEALAGSEATAAISCDSAFSAFAVLADGSGEATRTIAAEKATPVLAARAFAPLANKALPCSAGATCFDAEGVVHQPGPPPGPPMPVGRVAFPAPAGTAKRLVLSLDVKVGPWFPSEPSGKHLIYWFVVNKNPDMPGLLYFRGPGKNEAFARHGMQVPHARKIKVIKKWAAEVGRTYHIVNDYDMAGNRYTVTITDAQTGEVQVVLTSRPNVSSYVVKRGSKFLVDMGFYPGKVPTEVPSYGWLYSNVHVEAFVN
jgi:hypothetical protein